MLLASLAIGMSMNEGNPLVTRQFVSPITLLDALQIIMGFHDARQTLTLEEGHDMVRFHIDYVESNDRLGEILGLFHADDDGGTYIEYTSDVQLEPYSYPLSGFIWAMATVGIIWLLSGFFAFTTASVNAAWIFVFSLIALMILNRIDNETSPDYETKQREQQFLMQRLNTAFENAEKSNSNDNAQAQISS